MTEEYKRYLIECGYYTTRYQAEKARRGVDKVVKVDGGYKVMSPEEYRVWRLQK